MIGRGGPVRKEIPVKPAVDSANDWSFATGAPDLKSVNLPVWESASIRQGSRSLVKSFFVNSQRTGQRLVDPPSNSMSSGLSVALVVITSKITVTFPLRGNRRTARA